MGLFAFILAWQEFLIALTITYHRHAYSAGGHQHDDRVPGSALGPLMAGSVIIALPVVILFTYFQKYLISGLTMGAVKS